MKCPICGLDFRGFCPHTYVDLINEFNLELNRHMQQTSKDKKEIEQLKKVNEDAKMRFVLMFPHNYRDYRVWHILEAIK